MIPTWLKILWNLCGFFMMIYGVYPLSGLFVKVLTELSGNKFHNEVDEELFRACTVFIVLFMFWMLSFVLIMVIYQIPFNEWIG